MVNWFPQLVGENSYLRIAGELTVKQDPRYAQISSSRIRDSEDPDTGWRLSAMWLDVAESSRYA